MPRGYTPAPRDLNNRGTKQYLGDGCYVAFDGYALWLTTEDGLRVTNTICLEPEVYKALVEYVGVLNGEVKP